jgi:hypothetical protein
MPAKRFWVAAAVGVGASFALGACGGGSSEAPVQTYTLSGTVIGLASAGLVLSVNVSSNVSVASGASTVSLASSLASGSSYAVAVQTQPIGETCAVAGGTGTIGSANVANVVVTCSNQTYAIGGSISGLTTSGLVLVNGGDMVTVLSGAASFTMPTKVAYASSYAVTIKTHPAGLECTITNNSGTMPPAPVSNIGISCVQASACTLNVYSPERPRIADARRVESTTVGFNCPERSHADNQRKAHERVRQTSKTAICRVRV